MFILYLFICGAVLGSFLDVLNNRGPKNLSILKPRSHCEYCNHVLTPIELIPILSYIFLRGKCLKCKKRIGIEAVIVEIILGSLFVFSFIKYGFTYQFVVALVLSVLIVSIFISDIKYMIILDSPLVVGSIVVLGFNWYLYGFNAFLNSLLAGILLFTFMYLMGLLGKVMFKREALGGGDIKLSFVIGTILGFKLGLVSLVFSTFLALPYALVSLILSTNREVAFGPFLISSTCVVFLFMEKFMVLFNVLVGL